MALRKNYTLSKFTKDEFMGNSMKETKTQMPALQLDNLFVITMDFMELKSSESQPSQLLQKQAISCPPRIQLMKKVIVRMVNNSLQLNFHPKLSELAKNRPLNVSVTLTLLKHN